MEYLKLNVACTMEHLIMSMYCNRPLGSDLEPQKNCWIAKAVNGIIPNAEVFLNGIFPSNKSKQAIPVPKFVLERMSFFDEATVKERMFMKPFDFDITLDDTMIKEILTANNWSMNNLLESIKESENITLYKPLKLIEA